jgi:phospholipid N-methyltransferase
MNSPAPVTKLSAETPDWLLMVRKFAQQGRTIASFSPSSRFLSRKIVEGIDYAAAKCIVELGAGTGPITKELAARVQPHTRLIVVEQDADFCKRLREKYSDMPNAEIIEGDAAKIDTLLAERGLSAVDHVISGLPLPSFPAALRDAIVASSARALGEAGTFRQLTIMPLIYRKIYTNYFSDVKFNFVARNLPPAGVYVCRGYKAR